MCHAFLPVIYCLASSDKVEDSKFLKKYGAIREGLHSQNSISRHWNLLTIGRWSVVSLILVMLRDYNYFQIQASLLLSVLYQCLIISGKPCKDRNDNYMLLFNEITVTLYIYALIGLSDYNTSYEMYEKLGLALLAIVMFAFILNILNMLVTLLQSLTCLYRKIRSRFFNQDRVIKLRPEINLTEKPKSIPFESVF